MNLTFTDPQGRWVTLSKDALQHLIPKEFRRLDEGRFLWRVYDPVLQRELTTTIGDYHNG